MTNKTTTTLDQLSLSKLVNAANKNISVATVKFVNDFINFVPDKNSQDYVFKKPLNLELFVGDYVLSHSSHYGMGMGIVTGLYPISYLWKNEKIDYKFIIAKIDVNDYIAAKTNEDVIRENCILALADDKFKSDSDLISSLLNIKSQ